MLIFANDLFNVNKNLKIQCHTIRGYNFYQIENFFTDPDKLVEFLDINQPQLHKSNEESSKNGVHFYDRRHTITGAYQIIDALSSLDIGKPPAQSTAVTNFTKFNYDKFNNYQDSFWWPHRDYGYTAIIYLNKYSGPGTNLYEDLNYDNLPTVEHSDPWRPKQNYKLFLTAESSFNRLILFQARVFLHGMSIVDDTFFKEERKNLAVFFS